MTQINPNNSPLILTINGGSSSIKFAVFSAGAPPKRLLIGQVERIGSDQARLVTSAEGMPKSDPRPVKAQNFQDGAKEILSFLKEQSGESKIAGIGHRVVHGGVHLLANQLITNDLLAELRRAQPLDLAHLPREIALIEVFRSAFPGIPQAACFDTAFHRDMPRVAQLLPIPRRYQDAGLRRFGFHGLSYTYLMKQLQTLAGPEAAHGRVILAHLGSGASMAAVHQGKSVDTTMSFTPTSGLVMGTRPGDMDPGLLVYLMQEGKRSTTAMDKFISEECGLLGISETSSDMRDLLDRRTTDPRAADAVDLFCYQARKFLGAFFAAMNGLDTLIFSGGIGEHAPQVRAGICQGLECLGINIDSKRNTDGNQIISTDASRVTVRVIPTDEEAVIADAVLGLTQNQSATERIAS
jgi:acetate kinase